jgi:hypothetical protein
MTVRKSDHTTLVWEGIFLGRRREMPRPAAMTVPKVCQMFGPGEAGHSE